MPAPVFGPDQMDPSLYGPNATGGTVSLTSQGGQPRNEWYDWLLRQSQNQTPGASPYQAANQGQARAQQDRVIQDVQRLAAGDPNSAAQQQLRQGYGAAQSQQASLGSTMRGQSAGAAMRGVQAGQQGIQRGYAGDSQMLQLQEQQAAQQMLAQMLAQQQGQDIAQAQGMAQGQLGAQSMDDALRQFYLSGMLNSDLLATEQQNQIARAGLGFQDQMNALTQQLVNNGVNAFGTGVTTAANTFGGKPGGTNG